MNKPTNLVLRKKEEKKFAAAYPFRIKRRTRTKKVYEVAQVNETPVKVRKNHQTRENGFSLEFLNATQQ